MSEAGAFVLAGLIVIAGALCGADWTVKRKCMNYGEMSGKHVQYLPFDTCYVKQGGEFMRWDEYRAWLKGGQNGR